MITRGQHQQVVAGNRVNPSIRRSRVARVESLDYLRGLMAVSVMLYHYATWTIGPQVGVLGKLGIYAVAAFYVLSGVSLGMVYRHRLSTGRDVLAFWIRRIFRIVPLFWLATAATMVMQWHSMTPLRAWMNFTMAFGVLDPSGAIATGAWSIGNEMFFYALLPLLIRLPRSLFAISVAIAMFYAWSRLGVNASLPAQWRIYVQPLNHLFLFAGGVAMVSLPRIRFPMLLGLAAVFVFYAYPMPAQIWIVTGWGRLAMSASTLAVVLVVYQRDPSFTGTAAKALAFMGQGCLSIYLLHPLVFRSVAHIGASGWLLALTSIATTLGLSYLTFRHIEAPMMSCGARLDSFLLRPVILTNRR